jgi:hypothetical protein
MRTPRACVTCGLWRRLVDVRRYLSWPRVTCVCRETCERCGKVRYRVRCQ